jgi:putative transcriptional regulator
MSAQPNMKLKLARVGGDFSQTELADLVGATRQTIGLIEKGKYNPSLKLCLKIAWALGQTLDQLFWKENENA